MFLSRSFLHWVVLSMASVAVFFVLSFPSHGTAFSPPHPNSTALSPIILADGSPATLKTKLGIEEETGIRLRPIAAGTNHACAILADDRVICWGENDWGQLGVAGMVSVSFPVFVSNLADAPVTLAAGEEHTCAILANGGIQCWGGNLNGQLGSGAPSVTPQITPVSVTGLAGKAIDLAAGSWHTCALLADGRVQCWGANNTGQLGIGSLHDQAAPVTIQLPGAATWITAGCNHTCALLQDGRMYCWGWNAWGQLGVSGVMQSTTPVQVTAVSGAGTTIEAGCNHTCAVYHDAQGESRLSCWGQSNFMQMPAEQEMKVSFLLMRAGMGHTCILTADHSMLCWGYNRYGQLGDGTTRSRHELAPVAGMTQHVFYMTTAAGANHTCSVLDDGEAYCWGSNMWGQIGNGSLVLGPAPRRVPDLHAVRAVSAGQGFTCATPADGSLWCWGKRFNTSFISDASSPTRLSSPDSGVAAVQTGMEHSCVLMQDGSIRCWGSNDYGQLGDGSTYLSTTPVIVKNLGGQARAVRVGDDFSCALLTDGVVRCWGRNNHGQLGLGSTQDRLLPATVSLPAAAKAIGAGGQHACAVLTDGDVYCWGENASGQIGDGGGQDRLMPVRVNLTGPAVEMAAGDDHTCARLGNGQVWCWGANYQGQLGNPDAGWERATPIRVSALRAAVTALDAGGETTCAVVDGGAFCWGLNLYGQVGDGSYRNHFSPSPVMGMAAGVQDVSAAFDHVCARMDDAHGGGAMCWGSDAYGQLGRERDLRWTLPHPLGETPPPYLTPNHDEGRAGSVFTMVGANFPPTTQGKIFINRRLVSSSLVIDESGQTRFFIDSRGAEPGDYLVTVKAEGKEGNGRIQVHAHGVLYPQEGGGLTVSIPARAARHALFIPFFQR